MESLKQCPEDFVCSPPEVSLKVGPVPSYISIVSSLLSCSGSILIIFIYAMFKNLRKSVAQTIITHLAVADFFNAGGIIIGGLNYLLFNNSNKSDNDCIRFGTLCVIQSYITQWTSATAFIWTTILALNFVVMYMCSSRHYLLNKSIPFLAIFAWLFPLTFLLPLLVLGRLGYSRYGASNWCYVQSGDYSGSQLKNSDVTIAFIFANWIWELLSIFIVVTLFAVMLVYRKVSLFKYGMTFTVDNSQFSTQYMECIY